MEHITVTALSHPGLLRENNEDSLVAGPWTLCGTVTGNPQTLVFPLGPPVVVAVADGIGGQPAGEVASAVVARNLALHGPALDGEDAVRGVLDLCNREVYAAAARDPARRTMGTTVAGVVLLADRAVVFNVGDSRVLAVRDGGLELLSVDDNPPPPPGRRTVSLLTQSLGGSREPDGIAPHLTAVPLDEGFRALVCTDGLTDPVPDEVIARVLREHDHGRAAYELWRAAIEAGGPDNITLALIGAGEE
ncbi:PP2C family protein-serine/threonine phosphatase [Streptomyces genisteinicus]|uniref:Serine/threonine-protein phosphatase n=1 Tax=Streptomyces genisteinicus TaxID=2768068 RepID=A0A7H0HUW2_9ACTN|nr:PP2C family serine/threonine-protein phosphatase [Streptomyces genisteinicus]QNP64328.1 serine/threonine-protein phosphatase [Streptomyces genisteinicus]